MLPSIEYLGHRISADGLHPNDSKVKALKDASTPANISQPKSFLGLLNYYGKFVPNLSTILAPLHSPFRKHTAWTWGTDQQTAFDHVKSLLTTTRQSQWCWSAMSLHTASVWCYHTPLRTAQNALSPMPCTPWDLQKSVTHNWTRKVWQSLLGVKCFHQYLAGRHFTILSDHKPMQHLFQEAPGIPALASACLQRWALTLSAYGYAIQYKPGQAHANADVLSRLPLPATLAQETPPREITLSLNML